MKLFTVKEVAGMLKVGTTVVYDLIEQRRLVAHRVGRGRGTLRVREEDLLAYLEECRLRKQVVKPKIRKKLRHLRL